MSVLGGGKPPDPNISSPISIDDEDANMDFTNPTGNLPDNNNPNVSKNNADSNLQNTQKAIITDKDNKQRQEILYGPSDHGPFHIYVENNCKDFKDYGTSDFIIVGAGASGCVLAHRLSEIPEWSVHLIEAGNKGNNVTDIPGMLIYSFLSPYNWGYLSTPQSTCCQGMSNQQCPFPRGRGLGGSSLINGMFYVRGNSDDYDQWRKLGCRGWSYQDVLPYFKKSEHADFPDADPHYHGFTGPLHVNYTAPPSLIENTFIEAATYNMGLDTVDYNAAKQIGVSPIQYGINFNKRQDTGSLFIKPIENKKNLQISLNSFVIKIIISDNKAVGVEFIKDGIRYQAFARKEVIICAGAVNSAQLLMLSGIGPRNDLEKLGIPVKNDLPVGESFIDHPVFLGLICSTKRRAEASALLEALQAYLRGEAPLTRSFGGESLGFVNVDDPNSTVPNIEFATFPQPRGGDLKRILNLNDQTTEDFLRLDPEVFAHVWVTLLYPKSRGKVYLKSNSPLDFPQIDLNLLSDKYNHDIKTLLKGLKYVIEFFTGKAFGNIDSYISFQLKVCEPYGLFSDKYWICALRQLTTSFFHPVGTTKIGRCQKTSVVDCNLMVHRMKNLRIAGEGIFPRIVGGHTYAPCLMIGEKLADIIKEFNGKL